MALTEEERKERRKIANKKYQQSMKGRKAQSKANKKYQQKRNYKQYKHKYYLKKKKEAI